MKTAVQLIFLLLLSIKSFSQNIVWEKLIDFLPNQDVINSIDQDSDSTFVFCGVDVSNIFFSKAKLNGDTLWKNSKSKTNCWGNEFIAHRNGKLFHFGNNYVQPCSKSNFLFEKLSANGGIISSWNYGDSGIGNILGNYAFLPDRGCLLPGQRQSTYYYFLSLMKLDSSGNLLWYKKYRDISETPGVIINRKGNYLLRASSGDQLFGGTVYHPYFIEVSPDGDSINSKYMIIQADTVDEVMDNWGMFQNEDGDYVFSLRIDSVNKRIGTVLERYAAVVMMDTLFNIKWKLYLHKGEGGVYSTTNIVELKDSTYVLIAMNTQPESNQFYFYRISKTGQVLDQKIFSSSLCNKIYTRAIKPLSDGSLIVSGLCYDNQNAYLARIDSVGLPMDIGNVTAVVSPTQSFEAQVYPNPFTQAVTFKLPSVSSYKLTLLNALGEEISSYSFSGTEFNLDASGLHRGLYMYVLRDEKGRTRSGKIVAE